MITNDDIVQKASAMYDWLVSIRRDFHRHPELGMEEYRTRDKIVEYLTALNIPFEKDIAKTAVVGFIEGKYPGKTVALRADMDALPIRELNDVPYKSVYDGKMHACGHDAHTTILLGTAKVLKSMQDQLKGNVKLFFQPAEETVGGAKPMIEAGVMENPKVDAVFGLHMAPDLQTGEIGIKYGQMNASSDTIKITVHGKNSHGASPHRGTDAIVIAAHVITALQTIVSRNVDPTEGAVVSIGVIEGGTQKNIVAEKVNMIGTVRTLDPRIRDQVVKRIDEILKYTTKSFGGSYTFELGTDGYAALVNDDTMVDLVKRSAIQLFNADRVIEGKKPSMGVEDFAYFAEAAPSAFFRLGCRNEAKGIIHNVHTPYFDIDEKALPIGVAMQVKNTLSFLNE